ncbi:MAG: hypothetical protein ACFUZC_20890 [Chthoniobacteraceae bacterium]
MFQNYLTSPACRIKTGPTHLRQLSQNHRDFGPKKGANPRVPQPGFPFKEFRTNPCIYAVSKRNSPPRFRCIEMFRESDFNPAHAAKFETQILKNDPHLHLEKLQIKPNIDFATESYECPSPHRPNHRLPGG